MKKLLASLLLLTVSGVFAACNSVEPPPPVDPPPTGENGTPSWLGAINDNTWVQIGNPFMDVDPLLQYPNWTFGGGATYHTAVIEVWNGAVARWDYLVLPFNGGHKGSSQNTVYEFGPFNSENPSWHWYGTDPGAYSVPSNTLNWPDEEGVGYYSDGLPSARHTYDHLVYLPSQNKVLAPFGYSVYGSMGGKSTSQAASFSFNQGIGGTYDTAGVYIDFPGSVGPGGGSSYDALTGLVWIVTAKGPDKLYSFDPVGNTYTRHGSGSPAPDNDTEGMALDHERRIIAIHSQSDRLVLWDISAGREGEFVEVFNYSGPLFDVRDIGFEYEPVGKTWVGYGGGAGIYTLRAPADYRNPDGSLNANAAWEWIAVAQGAGGIAPTPAGIRGTYGKFRYIKSIQAFAVINNPSDQGVFVYRVPAGGL